MDKKYCYSFFETLEDIIEKYHARDGTYCFHYHSFIIEQWSVCLPKHIYDKIDIGDYVIRILWTDNSNSIDDYYITFDQLFDWYNTQEKNNEHTTN